MWINEMHSSDASRVTLRLQQQRLPKLTRLEAPNKDGLALGSGQVLVMRVEAQEVAAEVDALHEHLLG